MGKLEPEPTQAPARIRTAFHNYCSEVVHQRGKTSNRILDFIVVLQTIALNLKQHAALSYDTPSKSQSYHRQHIGSF